MQYTEYSDEDLYTWICNASMNGYYVSYIRGWLCRDWDTLAHDIACSFQFPKYYGENWSALMECVTDLEWLHFSGLAIIVDEFTKVLGGDKTKIEMFTNDLLEIEKEWNEDNTPIQIILNK